VNEPLSGPIITTAQHAKFSLFWALGVSIWVWPLLVVILIIPILYPFSEATMYVVESPHSQLV